MKKFFTSTPSKPGATKKKLVTNISPPISCARGEMPETGHASNIGYMDLTWDEEEGKSYKRKRADVTIIESGEETDAEDRLQEKLIQLVKKADKEARKLAKLVGDNINTKKEIKEIAHSIRILMSQINTTEMMNIMKTRRTNKGPKPEPMTVKGEVECQTNTEGKAVKPDIKEMACQTDPIMKEIRDTCVTREQIRAATKYEEFLELKKYTWPDEVYTVKWEEGTEPPPTHDLVV